MVVHQHEGHCTLGVVGSWEVHDAHSLSPHCGQKEVHVHSIIIDKEEVYVLSSLRALRQ